MPVYDVASHLTQHTPRPYTPSRPLCSAATANKLATNDGNGLSRITPSKSGVCYVIAPKFAMVHVRPFLAKRAPSLSERW
ncbi:hypothetical protein VTO73DRAFT_9084 [Trametes versicolor]